MPDSLSTAAPKARILANLRLPALDGYAVASFGDYLPPGTPASPEWRPERERRDLARILPLIPEAERPDILVCAHPEYLPIPWDVHAFPGPKILLITDWNVCLRFLPDLCTLFDYCFTDWPGYRLLRRAGVANVFHQPLFGHDPGRFRPLGLPRNLDVSFCGNLNAGLHGDRNRLLAGVARWAHRTGRPVHLRQAFDGDYLEVLNRSRLVFNYSIRGEANMRLFEAMACGAAPLVEETNQEVGILFQEGRHYFRYPREGLDRKLDELLAQPELIAAVSEEARREVARHTKAKQYGAVLDAVLREAPGGPARPAQPLPPPQARKALAKIRVLGMGYTAQDAIREIQVREGECPGLSVETLPGLLFAVIDREAGPTAEAARKALEHLLSRPGLPDFLRAYLGLQAALRAKDWPAIPALAALATECLGSLDAGPGDTGPDALYSAFLPPVELGHGLNSDLNKAFREDLAVAGTRGDAGRKLLRSHCRFHSAEAKLALGRPAEGLSEALSLLEDLGGASPVSLPLFHLLIAAATQVPDPPVLRKICRAWFEKTPLDTFAWQRVADALGCLGDWDGRRALLAEFQILAPYFLNPEEIGMLAALARRGRADHPAG